MMDEGVRSDQIERAINREVAGALTVNPHGAGVFTIAPRSMGELMEFSKLMSVAGVCIRPVFRGNPGACLAITIQAMKWGADPFAVANKAYVVKNRAGEETIAYEAQLIHAVVNASSVLVRRLRPVYEGQGQERSCRIVGFVKGEDEALEYQSPPISKIAVKNSPLWQGDPDQQLFYFSTRAWARRHVPEILLGIYAPEEFTETIDLTPEPEPRREDFIEQRQPEPEPEAQFEVIDLDGEVFRFHEAARACDAMRVILEAAARHGAERLDGAWEDNAATISELIVAGFTFLRSEAQQKEGMMRPAALSPAAGQLPADGSPTTVEDTASRRGDDRDQPRAGAEVERIERVTPSESRPAHGLSDAGSQTAGSIPATGANKPQGGPQASETAGPSTGTRAPEQAHSAPAAAPEQGRAPLADIPSGGRHLGLGSKDSTTRPFPGDLPAGQGRAATAEELRGNAAAERSDPGTFGGQPGSERTTQSPRANPEGHREGNDATTAYKSHAAPEDQIKDQWKLV